jgi:hypothetical protein
LPSFRYLSQQQRTLKVFAASPDWWVAATGYQ